MATKLLNDKDKNYRKSQSENNNTATMDEYIL